MTKFEIANVVGMVTHQQELIGTGPQGGLVDGLSHQAGLDQYILSSGR